MLTAKEKYVHIYLGICESISLKTVRGPVSTWGNRKAEMQKRETQFACILESLNSVFIHCRF